MRDPDAMLRAALFIRQSWQDRLFATDKARWQDVTLDDKTRWLAESAPAHAATYKEFLDAAKVVAGVTGWKPAEEWRLFQQFRDGQSRFEEPVNDNLKTLHQVWHREPEGFVHAYTVHCKDLLTALVLPMIEPKSDQVSVVAAPSRPTTFGDVIVTPENDAYAVANTRYGPVFDLVDFARLKQDVIVHAQMREDFQLGQEEAARGDFAESVKHLSEMLTGPCPSPEPPAQQQEIER